MNKKLLIIGFIFGAFVLPFIVTLGLILPLPEFLMHLVPGFRLTDPLIRQIGPDTYEMPLYGWVLAGLINGSLWASIFWIIYMLKNKKSNHE